MGHSHDDAALYPSGLPRSRPGRYHPESPAGCGPCGGARCARFAGLERRAAPEGEDRRHRPGHPRRFVERMLAAVPATGHIGIDADTILSPASGRARPARGRGGGRRCRAVVAGEADNAFCAGASRGIMPTRRAMACLSTTSRSGRSEPRGARSRPGRRSSILTPSRQ